jgi:hypothetical protein
MVSYFSCTNVVFVMKEYTTCKKLPPRFLPSVCNPSCYRMTSPGKAYTADGGGGTPFLHPHIGDLKCSVPHCGMSGTEGGWVLTKWRCGGVPSVGGHQAKPEGRRRCAAVGSISLSSERNRGRFSTYRDYTNWIGTYRVTMVNTFPPT